MAFFSVQTFFSLLWAFSPSLNVNIVNIYRTVVDPATHLREGGRVREKVGCFEYGTAIDTA